MDKIEKKVVFAVILLMGIMLGVVLGAYLSRNDYRQGQIDALIGNVKYELLVNPDSTVTWHKKGQ